MKIMKFIMAAAFVVLAACSASQFQDALSAEKMVANFASAVLVQYDNLPACGSVGADSKFCFDVEKSQAAHAALAGFNQSIDAAQAALDDPNETDEQRRVIFAAMAQAESALAAVMAIIPIVG